MWRFLEQREDLVNQGHPVIVSFYRDFIYYFKQHPESKFYEVRLNGNKRDHKINLKKINLVQKHAFTELNLSHHLPVVSCEN